MSNREKIQEKIRRLLNQREKLSRNIHIIDQNVRNLDQDFYAEIAAEAEYRRIIKGN